MNSTCKHHSADALTTGTCGQDWPWVCVDCGVEFSRVKPHHVMRFVLHSEDCDRKQVPAQWCSCHRRVFAGCVDCNQEFSPEGLSPDGFTEIPA